MLFKVKMIVKEYSKVPCIICWLDWWIIDLKDRHCQILLPLFCTHPNALSLVAVDLKSGELHPHTKFIATSTESTSKCIQFLRVTIKVHLRVVRVTVVEQSMRYDDGSNVLGVQYKELGFEYVPLMYSTCKVYVCWFGQTHLYRLLTVSDNRTSSMPRESRLCRTMFPGASTVYHNQLCRKRHFDLRVPGGRCVLSRVLNTSPSILWVEHFQSNDISHRHSEW